LFYELDVSEGKEAFLLALTLCALQAMSVAPVPAHSDGGSLVINELMILPLASSSTEMGQWIELHNDTGNWINLSEWYLENEYGRRINFSSILLPPGGYFVVGSCGIPAENGGYTPDAVWNNFSLSTSGSLMLSNGITDARESLSWDSSWDILQGTSLERVNPGWSASDRGSWRHCLETFGNGDKGTPGLKNSVYSDGFGQNTWAFIKAFVK
jgi:hypothetical protein